MERHETPLYISPASPTHTRRYDRPWDRGENVVIPAVTVGYYVIITIPVLLIYYMRFTGENQ